MDKEYTYCLRCHRRLRNEKAKELGYGKICYEKAKNSEMKNTLFKIKPVVKE